MTDESWRVKTYYDPRVLLETSFVLDNPYQGVVCCFTGAQRYMLSQMCQYLHRRATFASEHKGNYYLAPTNDEWDAISAIVSDLEEVLMGCDFSTIVGAINDQTAALVAALDAIKTCTCAMSEYTRTISETLPDLGVYIDEQRISLALPSETEGEYESPETDNEKCELAQAWYYWVYELYTEYLLPWADNATDTLLGLMVSLDIFATAGLFVGLPATMATTVIVALLDWAVDGSIQDFTNWLLAAKNEIICAVYENLPDLDAVSAALSEFIDGEEELSAYDKLILKAVASQRWYQTWVFRAQQETGRYDTYLVPGACDDCEQPENCDVLSPCDLDDWTLQYPESMECVGGVPRIKSGYGIYEAATCTHPQYGAWFKLWWVPAGDDSTASMDVNLKLSPSEEQVNLGNTGSKPVGVPTTNTWFYESANIGDLVRLQAVQAAWWGDLQGYCIYTSDPDA